MGQYEAKMRYSNEELRRMWYENNLKDIEVTREVVDLLFGYENVRILRGDTYDEGILIYCYEKLDEYNPKYDAKKAERVRKKFLRNLERRSDNIQRISVPRVMFRAFVAVVIIILSIQFISLAMNGNFFDSVATWTKEMFLESFGGVTIKNKCITSASIKQYSSIHGLEEVENIDNLLLPTYLPDSCSIEQITFYSNVGTEKLRVEYESAILQVDMHQQLLTDDNVEGFIEYTAEGIDYYISFANNEIVWQNENTYQLICMKDISQMYPEIILSIERCK